MKIVFVSSEASPLAKSGGLGDAVSALSMALAARGHQVRLILPLYRGIDRANLKELGTINLALPSRYESPRIFETTFSGSSLKIWLIDQPDLFDRSGLYGPDGSHDWPDNLLRFVFFCRSVFEICRQFDFIPDIFHAHDWQSALVCWLLKNTEQENFASSCSTLTIHNLGYQGLFDPAALKDLIDEPFDEQSILTGASLNLLATGIRHAHVVNTVSPTYAKEILQPDMSCGLHGLLESRKSQFVGILNGMDYNAWNPEKDKTLSPDNYSHQDLSGKTNLKIRLQQKAGLPVNPKIPLFGMVTRLTSQKGIDLIDHVESPALANFRSNKAQLVILGTGEHRYEQALKRISWNHPLSCSTSINFSDEYSRLIEAGSDFFLMPSLYEPCGLNQLYSLRYGTLPIVRNTGGLADTIIDLTKDSSSGNGFVFDTPERSQLADAIDRAIAFHANKRQLNTARKRAMQQRFCWNDSSIEYEKLYRMALDRLR